MQLFIKNFIDWFQLKIRIDTHEHKPPFFKDGEIWWCSIGENIGGEISGKGTYFRRPVLVLRKLDAFSLSEYLLQANIRRVAGTLIEK